MSGFWLWLWIVTQVAWDVVVVVWIRSQMSINRRALEWMRSHNGGTPGKPLPTREGGVG